MNLLKYSNDIKLTKANDHSSSNKYKPDNEMIDTS